MLDPTLLARTTLDRIRPLYVQNEVMINLMITTNPSGLRKLVTRERLLDAMLQGAPKGTPQPAIERVADFGLAHFARTFNALITGCRTGDHQQLAAIYRDALKEQA